MFSWLFNVILATASADEQLEQSYALAYTASLKEKILLVVVGSPWCPACRVLEEGTGSYSETDGPPSSFNDKLVPTSRHSAPTKRQELAADLRASREASYEALTQSRFLSLSSGCTAPDRVKTVFERSFLASLLVMGLLGKNR